MSDTTGTDPTARAGFPAFSDLTDASRTSLICIACFLVAIFILGKSWSLGNHIFPKTVVRLEVVRDTHDHPVLNEKGKPVKKLVECPDPRRINVLWILKILTVLFHEMSHAFVGSITGGRVTYISVNSREGGETRFRPKPTSQPAYRPTLAAGYLGSCWIGCALLGAGFDALASKCAAVALVSFLIITGVFCWFFVRTKLALHHNWERITLKASKICGAPSTESTERLKKIKVWDAKMLKGTEKMEEREKAIAAMRAELTQYEPESKEYLQFQALIDHKEQRMEEVYKDKMVSLDLIAFIAAFITFVCILPAWLVADSTYLRFVIMFIGLFSATYAVQDIYEDGVKNNDIGGSDANAFARKLIPARPDRKAFIRRDASDPKKVKIDKAGYKRAMGKWENQLERKTKQLAWVSLVLQLLAILVTILAAVYFVQTTTAEQALRSRVFLASPWHLDSADLLEKARAGGQSVQDGLDWGKGKVEELMGDDGRAV